MPCSGRGELSHTVWCPVSWMNPIYWIYASVLNIRSRDLVERCCTGYWIKPGLSNHTRFFLKLGNPIIQRNICMKILDLIGWVTEKSIIRMRWGEKMRLSTQRNWSLLRFNQRSLKPVYQHRPPLYCRHHRRLLPHIFLWASLRPEECLRSH